MDAASKTKEQLLLELKKVKEDLAQIKRSHLHNDPSKCDNIYHSLINNINIGFFRKIIGDETRLIEANPAIVKMFGCKSIGEFLAMDINNIYAGEEDRSNFKKEIERNGQVKGMELKLKRVDGTIFNAYISAVLLNINDETYVDGVIEDITFEKQAQNYLENSDKHYELLFKSSPTGVILQNEKGIILDVNPVYCKITGYTREELIGKQIEILAPEHQKNDVQKNLNKLLKGEKLKHSLESKKKDGTIRYIELNESRILLPDGSTGILSIANDITDRKQKEEELHLLSSVIDQSQEGIALADLDGNLLFLNNAFALMHGYIAEDLVGKHLSIFHNSEQMPAVEAANKKIIETGGLNGEIWHCRKDGSVFPTLMHNTLFYDESGKPAGIIATLRDITQKKITEERIKSEHKQSERYRKIHEALFSAVPNPVYYKDAEGRYLGCNNAFTEQLGVTKEELKGKTVFDLWPSEHSKVYHKMDLELMANPQKQEYEWQLKDKNGETRVVIFSKDVFYDEDGKVAGIIGAYTDITDRKKAEEEIRKLFRAVEQSPTIVMIANLNGDIEYVNPKFCQVTGYSAEEAIGENTNLLKSGKTPKETYINLWQTITSGKEWHGEFQNKRKDGSLYWEMANIFPLKDENGKITHFIGMKEDITERKKMEQDLITAKNKAEESDKLKSSFLANMSHEIRTPMNAIIGFSQLLTEPDLEDEERDHYISLIQNSGNDLLNLIDDIIDISKIEAGQLKIFKSQYFLNNIMIELFDSYHEFIKTKKNKDQIDFKYNKPKNAEKVVVYTDIDRMKQIIRNLLTNAIKFTDSGMVEFGFDLLEEEDSPTIQFYVRDTGIGISEDKIDIIFESFRQANDSDIRLYGGTGLGLAITRKMVEVLGGKIWVSSSPGQGSTFYFTTPYFPVSSSIIFTGKNPEKPHLKRYKWQSKAILIVEDNDQSYFFFENVLKKSRVKISRAINGKEAIKLCKQNQYDVVLMDIQLPGIDGFETTKRIKKLYPDLPIIAQTAYALAGEKERCLNAGCDNYIPKPIKIPELLSLISTYIETA